MLNLPAPPPDDVQHNSTSAIEHLGDPDPAMLEPSATFRRLSRGPLPYPLRGHPLGDKVAHISKQTNESAEYSDAAQLIATSLARAVTLKGNTAFLSNASAPTGLLNIAGVVDGGTLGTNLDVLSDAITSVEVNGRVHATYVHAPDAVQWRSQTQSGRRRIQPLQQRYIRHALSGVFAGQRRFSPYMLIMCPAIPWTASFTASDSVGWACTLRAISSAPRSHN